MKVKASSIFTPADILLPINCDMEKWAVIACDQFTSDISYWDGVAQFVGSAPSTLHMILPEAYLGKIDEEIERQKIYENMDKFLQQGNYKEIENSYIYVKRTLQNGSIRRGLVGCIDLEEYSFDQNSSSAVRATEGTVMKRLPPRVKIRKAASIELPHVMIFVDDPDNVLLADDLEGEKLYDFDLMMHGGHIQGYAVKDIFEVKNRLDKLSNPKELEKKYNVSKEPILFAMGDGNHSLAAAKLCWEDMKENHDVNAENNFMRYALVEIVNIHDPAVVFEPIHKVVFNTESKDFISNFKKKFSDVIYTGVREKSDKKVEVIAGKEKHVVYFRGNSVRSIIANCEDFISEYSTEYGGKLDYIHGDDEARNCASKENNVGLIMPSIDKNELFASVMMEGVFPRKSFSIGTGPDKRYYLEARRIH